RLISVALIAMRLHGERAGARNCVVRRSAARHNGPTLNGRPRADRLSILPERPTRGRSIAAFGYSAGPTASRSTDRNYTAGPVRRIGGLCGGDALPIRVPPAEG